MELKLLRPFDQENPEFESDQDACRLKDKWEFADESAWVIYQAKVFYESFGDPNRASELLEDGLKTALANADLLACLAECYSRLPAKLEEARRICDKSLAINDQSDYAHTIMARVNLALGEPFDAYRSAMAALMLNSSNFEAGVYLGAVGFEIAAAEGNVEEMKRSVDNLRLTLSLNPRSLRLQRIIVEKERRLAEFRSDQRGSL